MNIYLVQASDNHGPNKFLPLAIAYQWCYGKNDNWTLKDVIIEKPLDYCFDNPQIVAMSCYVWNWEYNKVLAQTIKQTYPQCIIVVGGPQVTKHDKDFFNKHPYFDVAVHGEGEQAFKEILNRPLGAYDNILHVQTPTHMPNAAQRLRSLKDIPSPILEGFYEPIMAKYPKDTMWQVTWESLRGCPYHCSFCDIGESYWNKLTLFDTERCKAEIEWMGKNRIEYVSVCDSNWGLLERDKELTDCVLKTKEKYGYPMWFDATWSKNNIERNFEIAMQNQNSSTNIFKGITVALQSFNDTTLESIDRFNLDFEKFKTYFTKYKENNIPTYSELIWPLPNETYNSLKQGIQQLIDMGQDNYLMIHPLVVTDNSPMGNKAYQKQHGLDVRSIPLDTVYLGATDDYIMEYTDAVYSTSTANHDTVIEGHMYAWLTILMYYYGWGHYIAKYMRKQGVLETELFEDLLQWIKENTQTLLYKEYSETKQSLYNVYNNNKLWGRQVLGNNDIFWEYKGASSIVLHNNVTRLENELIKFMNEKTDVAPWKVKSIVQLGLLMCRSRDLKYPIQTKTTRDVAYDMLNIDSDTIIIDHEDNNIADNQWYNKAYHWNRKSGYWKCTASKTKKPLDIYHK
tara:strand:+ start:3397 stop:5271 length:1875 start_codon:yes stop_codon:yes gene_type:complete